MWQDILLSLEAKSNLSVTQIDFAFNAMLSDGIDASVVREFLQALKNKGESVLEVEHATEVILSKANPFPTDIFSHEVTIDTCGTGGDGLHTLNISTMVALVIASTGTTVFKHGNRAASSKSGSADVLEALGIRLDADNSTLVQSAHEAKIAFLFAQAFHPALRFVAPIRRELGFRTIFNYLGPLVNPARPNTQIVGVSDEQLASAVATSLAKRGVKAIVLRGADGLDEISIACPTTLWLALDGSESVRHIEISPETFGEKMNSLEHIRGGEPQENAQAIIQFAQGKSGDIINSAVAMNASCAMVAIDSHQQDITDIERALRLRYSDMQDLIRSGIVEETLVTWQSIQK